MNYYKKINLQCLGLLKDYLFNHVNTSINSLPITRPEVKFINLPINLLNVVNAELNLHGISNIDYCRIYLWPKNSVQFPHVDGVDTILHCAINIPLYGGEKSIFQWLGGDFEVKPIDLVRVNQKAFSIVWKSDFHTAESIEIKDGCYLIRIDQPHQAIASADTDRCLFTMRVKGNPTFEDLYDRLPASTI
jgi:hypothetical protein